MKEGKNCLTEFAGKKRILVRNKTDLQAKLVWPEGGTGGPRSADGAHGVMRPSIVVDVSCLDGRGIETLKDAIKELTWSSEIKSEMLQVMINSPHQDALNRARGAGIGRAGFAHRRRRRG